MARYEWVLLDADGTLFDYDRAEAAALASSLSAFEVESSAEVTAAYRDINRRIWQAFERGEITQAALRTRRFAELFVLLGVKADPHAFSCTYLEHLACNAMLVEGAETVVRSLRAEVRLVLLTNGLADVQRPRLARSAIRGLFDAVVISEEVGAAKPHPQIFEVCFERMGRPDRRNVLMVGDSLSSDIRGGIEYGLDTCWFNPARVLNSGDVVPRFQISSLVELLPIVLGDE